VQIVFFVNSVISRLIIQIIFYKTMYERKRKDLQMIIKNVVFFLYSTSNCKMELCNDNAYKLIFNSLKYSFIT